MLKVKNRLNEVLYSENEKTNVDSKGKLNLHIENVDFLLQNSVSKAQLDKGKKILESIANLF